ncbi:MAG: protein-glutamate O-methyltransferase CheR [Nitrospirae bacterium]|nr:protein-glutamate O-methyltransferase CheR [Nitrospirota bacterium]
MWNLKNISSVSSPELLQEILTYVRDLRGIDFSIYRENTIRRRLMLRMQTTGRQDYASYLGYIREIPEELDELIDAFSIKVSHFFRNPFVFEVLRDFVLPDLIKDGGSSDLRVWCAGCARGEEAYSVAMLFHEITSKEQVHPNIFILATDIDRDALRDAVRGQYKSEALSEVKKGYLERYFISAGDGLYQVNDSIRSMVGFSYHDITSGVPPKEGIFSDYNLILCRNVLIYFDISLQEKTLRFFSGHLSNRGLLVLGEAESLHSGVAAAFSEVMPRTKIFRKEADPR